MHLLRRTMCDKRPKAAVRACNQGACGEVDGISEVSARSGGYPPSFSLTSTLPASSSCRQPAMSPLAKRRPQLGAGSAFATVRSLLFAASCSLPPCASWPSPAAQSARSSCVTMQLRASPGARAVRCRLVHPDGRHVHGRGPAEMASVANMVTRMFSRHTQGPAVWGAGVI